MLLQSLPFVGVGTAAYGIQFAVKLVPLDIFAVTAVNQIVTVAFILGLMPVYNRVSLSSV